MGERTYKQLNWTSRIKLETMLKHGHSKKEIAEELGVHISTVYRELKRGETGGLNGNYCPAYSAETAEKAVRRSMRNRGRRKQAG